MQQLRAFLNDLLGLLIGLTVRDVVDIALISIVFFLLLNLIRQSRSQVALRGLLIVLLTMSLLYLATLTANLAAMKALLEGVWVIIALMFLISFQNEFKKGLTEYGRLPVFRALFRQQSTPIEEVIRATERLSESKVGALFCIERRNSLRPYLESGTQLDAVVSTELLRTIFSLYTPLHDGAVIIRNNRVAAAACLLPLSNQQISTDLGTRHRAALGLAEETDALVIVVSEETGTISLAHDGRLQRPETPDSLRIKLRDLLELPDDEEEADAEGG